MPLRLGDDIDDFCVKCKRLTNHACVSMVEEKAAKVRCRTCYHDHDYRNEEPLPSKKELKKAALLAESLKASGGAEEPDDEEVPPDADPADGDEATRPAAKKTAAKKASGAAVKKSK